ncbi:MAG: hypothetical protein HOW97_17355, partial [Catenulispora sp.]|nr:hypothetical protein [Catenulispora sp.]
MSDMPPPAPPPTSGSAAQPDRLPGDAPTEGRGDAAPDPDPAPGRVPARLLGPAEVRGLAERL